MSPEPVSPRASVLADYRSRVRAFSPNARAYLVSVLITGATLGIFRLLFNFYVLSLGYNEALLGNLITTSNMTALALALPLGWLVSRIGRKAALVGGAGLVILAVAAMGAWPGVAMFYAMNALLGAAQSLSSVAMGPFLMENSGEDERAYLFSFSSGLQMASQFVGNWMGGYLPSWVAGLRGVAATSAAAYSGAMLAIAAAGILGVLPLFLLRQKPPARAGRGDFDPFKFAKGHPRQIFRLFFPLLLVSIGAGLFVPFMNVFFRVVHHQPDPVVGGLMAWGSLAMGVGLLIAPPLADRLGKLRLVVITQGLSIPFMILLGFAPWFWVSALAYYVRMGLMNMSNPIYQNFVLEQVDEDSRATVASLYSMVWNFGRAFSPSVSGALQVTAGFGPPFAIAIALYAVAISLYYAFFLRRAPRPAAQPAPGD
jgi:MFS family permease